MTETDEAKEPSIDVIVAELEAEGIDTEAEKQWVIDYVAKQIERLKSSAGIRTALDAYTTGKAKKK